VIGLLSELRDRVQGIISATNTDDSPLEVDELESGFTRSTANWYDAACGVGRHTYYTYATDTQTESTNNAVWHPALPTAGSYRVFAHIPQACGLAKALYAARQARYTITYSGGTATRVVDQNTGSGTSLVIATEGAAS
jgi:hypothetical protein